ncbi:C4-dicarboxylate ABC transporter [Methylobacter psychrophilus]|uniref:C4-dicarboxylate ABC transporter n=1 Tax=Methylobacter psychrophilus TaxID=96941 RepID=UPI0021D4BFBA|nr:C4-dicarboxylate ABC transporter [Methylobacter psychrophilus]
MLRFILAVVLFLFSATAAALDNTSFTIGSMEAGSWKLQGIHVALTDLSKNPQKLTVTIKQLRLPKPFDDLNLVNIQCSAFSWQANELLCTKGRAKLISKQWQSPTANFSFHIKDKHSTLTLTRLQLAGGSISVNAEEQDSQWKIRINAKGVDAELLQKLFKPVPFTLKSGRVNLQLSASGHHSLIDYFSLTSEINGMTVQTKEGKFATEALSLQTKLKAQNHQGLWQWQSQTRFTGGALYVEPLYLEANQQPLIFAAQGNWSSNKTRVNIIYANYQQANTLAINGRAIVDYGKGIKLEQAGLSLHSDDLQKLSAIYLKPFFEQTPLAGITLAGTLNADMSIAQDSLTTLTAIVNKLAVNDPAERFKVEGGFGTINWSINDTFKQPSTFTWQQLQLHALPIGRSDLVFLTRANSFTLLKKPRLPFLGGVIAINQLDWQAKKQDEPEISFAGSLTNVSLEQWSKAFNWTPLSGTISGNIPKVEYRNKTLNLDGELLINVFDGEIKVTKLASSGLFTDFPSFYSDLEINNLDLDQLTGKFDFGGITGKLSGFVRQLSLENWHPVSFYAWLGTPDDDDSRHRISQKAVKNIASIGGGGASDILSRSFLNIFETFGYDKIGLGCYLHDGVCQMMGVKAVPEGYAIITGGGLPRLDVIGYNPRLDWTVLMERLKRISTTDEVIVK